jgi:hypothetical protein
MMTISLIRVTERPPDGLTSDEMKTWLSTHTDEVLIHHDDHMKLSDLNSAIIPVGWINGFSDRIWLVMDLHLQAETGNEYQGDTCSFSVEAIMTQEGVPPPVQSGNKIILENKDESWNPILGDGIWGIVKYNTSTLTLDIHCEGLPPLTAMQVSLNSPEVATWFPGVTDELYEKMASAMADNEYKSPPDATTQYGVNFVRGYWNGGLNLSDTWIDGTSEGIYNIAQGAGHATNYGGYDSAPVTDANGELDDNITTSGLPSGEYIWIKVIIKEDASPWTVYLVEKTFGLFFTLP